MFVYNVAHKCNNRMLIDISPNKRLRVTNKCDRCRCRNVRRRVRHAGMPLTKHNQACNVAKRTYSNMPDVAMCHHNNTLYVPMVTIYRAPLTTIHHRSRIGNGVMLTSP